jgi:putative SOS response-associated peptidase YedK
MNDRTPVILPPDRIDAWLDPELTDKTEVQKLITGSRRARPWPGGQLGKRGR